MKKIVTLVVVSFVMAGCNAQKTNNGLEEATQMQNQVQNQGQDAAIKGQYNENNPFEGSLQAALKLGLSLKCTYTDDDFVGEGVVKGNAYAGKMKTAEGNGNIIMKDNCMWSWQEGQSNGIKTCFDNTGSEDSENTEIEDDWSGVGQGMNNNYKCYPTVVSDSTFTPPTNVNFADMDQIMQSGEIPDWMKEQ